MLQTGCMGKGRSFFILEGKCYQLKDVIVRQFKGTKYLSVGLDCQIEAIEGIGDVIEIETQNDNCDPLTRVFEAEMIAAWCTTYKDCDSCKAKIKSQDVIVAEWHICRMMMKFSCRRNKRKPDKFDHF